MSCSGWIVMARRIPTSLPPQDPESPTDTVSPTPTFNSTSFKILWTHRHNAGRSWRLPGKWEEKPAEQKQGNKSLLSSAGATQHLPHRVAARAVPGSGKDPHPMGEGLGVQAA